MRNNKKIKMRPRWVAIIILVIVIISVALSCIYVTRNKVEKQVTAEGLRNDEMAEIGEIENVTSETTAKALPTIPESWDQTKVTPYLSEDNIYVPVPIGFSISSDENERYVNGTWLEKKGNSANIEWTTGGTYPWTQNTADGIWQSGNNDSKGTTSEMSSNEIEVGANGGRLVIEWSISARSGDLTVTITNTETEVSQTVLSEKVSTQVAYNNLVYKKCNRELNEGKYIINVTYKNQNSPYMLQGVNRGYIKSGTIFKYDEEGNESVIAGREKSGGFVIYEGTEEVTDAWDASINRNQFVWVPVKNASSRIYERNGRTGKIKARLWEYTEKGRTAISNADGDTKGEAGVSNKTIRSMSCNATGRMQGYSRDTFYKELETEYNNTINSIEKYGGFYIGRYETGAINTNTPVVRRMNTDLVQTNWDTKYARMKNISTNPNIQTSMIWGSLWDETLQWLIDTGEKKQSEIATDSKSWGNYINAQFTYINTSGETERKNSNSTKRIPTGSTEYTKANNIYDLAGNCFESTLEHEASSFDSGSNYSRGGYGGGGYSSAHRFTWGYHSESSYYGARAYLYIK